MVIQRGNMKINKEVQKVLNVIGDPLPTCSLKNLKLNSITFNKKANIIIANPLEKDLMEFIDIDNAEWTFWNYHNWYWQQYESLPYIQIKSAIVSDQATLGADGIGRIKYNGDNYIDPIHIGGLLVGQNVHIGPQSVVHRGVLDDTIIGDNVIIGSLNNIGHNAIIGDRTIITSNVAIGGSAKIDADCYIGMGAVIRDNITICNNAYIGMGSVVTKDITKPGKWFGNPAIYGGKYE